MSATQRQGLAALHHAWTNRPNIIDLALERSRLTATTTGSGEYKINSRKFPGVDGIVDATAWAEGHLGNDQ